MLNSENPSVLVFGATGATGRLLVNQLLSLGIPVNAVARSKGKMLSLVENKQDPNLKVTEASVYDLSDEELQTLVSDSSATVSCLGHNMTLKGLFGKPRDLVQNTAQRVCTAIEKGQSPKKFILMGTIGAYNPLAEKSELQNRSWGERLALQILRKTVPPHKDNEMAAQHVANVVSTKTPNVEWAVVRPDALVDEPVSEYTLHTTPPNGLFDSKITSRSNVAALMCQLIGDSNLWESWKFKMPVIVNKDQNKKK